MQINALNQSRQGENTMTLSSGSQSHSIDIPSGTNGYGSCTSGGELWFRAMATRFCKDIYWEAAKLQLAVGKVEV